jgi:hypothetical protein
MASIDISLAAVYQELWNVPTTAFTPDLKKGTGFTGITDYDRAEYSATGAPYYGIDEISGLEYFLPVKMTYPVNVTVNSALGGSAQASQLKSWNLPNPVISLTCRKTIIRTPMTERRGTVKELINIEDYVIRIRCMAIAGTNELPEDQVRQLRELFESGIGVSIQNAITDIFLLRPDRSGSDNVVISDLHFAEVVGVKNVRGFELTLESDEAFNLIDIS